MIFKSSDVADFAHESETLASVIKECKSSVCERLLWRSRFAPTHLERQDALVGSIRSDFGPPADEIVQLEALARSHPQPLELSGSNPTTVDLALPSWGALLQAHYDPAYQPDARGLRRAREALCLHERLCLQKTLGQDESRTQLTPDACVLTASTSEAYSFVLHALCDPGDAILVPSPSYPLFDQLAQLAGVRLIHYSIAFDGAWHLELSSLPRHETLTREKIRAVVAVSPNNPTGNVLSELEYNALSKLGVPLVIDQVFRPYHHDESTASVDPLARFSHATLTIVLDGLSKRAAAPGLKLGWAWILGPGAEAFRQRVEMISDTFLSVSSPVQLALPEILQRESGSQAAVRARIAANREILKVALAETALTWIPGQAGWSEIIRFPKIAAESEWWRLLAEAGLLLQAGQLYDLPVSPSFVISNITPPAILAQGLERMLHVVDRQLGENRPKKSR